MLPTHIHGGGRGGTRGHGYWSAHCCGRGYSNLTKGSWDCWRSISFQRNRRIEPHGIFTHELVKEKQMETLPCLPPLSHSHFQPPLHPLPSPTILLASLGKEKKKVLICLVKSKQRGSSRIIAQLFIKFMLHIYGSIIIKNCDNAQFRKFGNRFSHLFNTTERKYPRASLKRSQKVRFFQKEQ